MSSPYFQAIDPVGAPDPVTPADTPGDPSGYAGVTPAGIGPAPYSITAPLDDLSAVTDAAGRLTGAGIVYPAGPRQAQSEMLLSSPAGYGAQDISAGYDGSGPGEGGWPTVPAVATVDTPAQGTGDYPSDAGTGTD